MPSSTIHNPAAVFLLSEAEGTLSRDAGMLDAGTLESGTVLGQITATGHYVQLDPAATDGSETASTILYAHADASAAAVPVAVVSRLAEVRGEALIWPAGIDTTHHAAAVAQLAAHFLIVR
jgi:hypothetical protein